jgi:hypothetical protein
MDRSPSLHRIGWLRFGNRAVATALLRHNDLESSPHEIEFEDSTLYRIGATADYRRSDYFFARTQSPELREAEWAHRIPPLRPWSDVIAVSGVTVALVLAAFAMLQYLA